MDSFINYFISSDNFDGYYRHNNNIKYRFRIMKHNGEFRVGFYEKVNGIRTIMRVYLASPLLNEYLKKEVLKRMPISKLNITLLIMIVSNIVRNNKAKVGDPLLYIRQCI